MALGAALRARSATSLARSAKLRPMLTLEDLARPAGDLVARLRSATSGMEEVAAGSVGGRGRGGSSHESTSSYMGRAGHDVIALASDRRGRTRLRSRPRGRLARERVPAPRPAPPVVVELVEVGDDLGPRSSEDEEAAVIEEEDTVQACPAAMIEQRAVEELRGREDVAGRFMERGGWRRRRPPPPRSPGADRRRGRGRRTTADRGGAAPAPVARAEARGASGGTGRQPYPRKRARRWRRRSPPSSGASCARRSTRRVGTRAGPPSAWGCRGRGCSTSWRGTASGDGPHHSPLAGGLILVSRSSKYIGSSRSKISLPSA